jgi:hypothetical protein
MSAETLLPDEILKRASLAGTEYAWHPSDIPNVIKEAEEAHLLNLGGQLQFRMPGATCECYWVEVTAEDEPELAWEERVARSAAKALADFEAVQSKYDFIAEGRRAFEKYLDDFEAKGGDLNEAMCFVWYVETEQGLARLKKAFRQ